MVINNISDYEYQQIVSTFIVFTNKEYKCSVCKAASLKRKDGEKIRKLKGCYDEQPMPVFRQKNMLFYKCPANYQSIEVGNYINLYYSSEQVALNIKSKMEAKLVDLFNILDNLRDELRTASDKRSKRNTHGRGKGSSKIG